MLNTLEILFNHAANAIQRGAVAAVEPFSKAMDWAYNAPLPFSNVRVVNRACEGDFSPTIASKVIEKLPLPRSVKDFFIE